jgi:hypothetical protein
MASLEANHVNFDLLGAKTTDDAEIVKAMATVKEGVSLGDIMEQVAEMRNVPLREIPEEYYTIPLTAAAQMLVPTVDPETEEPFNIDEEDDDDKLTKALSRCGYNAPAMALLKSVRLMLKNRIDELNDNEPTA